MARIWRGQGVDYGWQIGNTAYSVANTYDDQQITNDLNYLWNIGIKVLRIYLPGYTVSGTRYAQIQSLITRAKAMGFYVRWGVCTSLGSGALTASLWDAYQTAVIGTFVPFAITSG